MHSLLSIKVKYSMIRNYCNILRSYNVLSRAILQKHFNTKGVLTSTSPIKRNIKHGLRNMSSVTAEESYVKKFMKTVGWMDQSRTRLKLTGYFLYECVPDKIEYKKWFDKLDLPDTFASWFAVTELHVWMLLVRYMADDNISTLGSEKNKYVKGDGHFVRNCIIEALWADVANRIKLLEGANPSIAKKQVSELSEQFQAALVAYDEGLQDDRVLAAAIWRRFYCLSEDTKAENVEQIVKFIRHQISELDKIPSENLKWKPNIEWISLEQC